jgi:DNA repair exonuclease SbcCD ATPase subunit
LKEDLERAKKECNKLSHMLQNNIQSYEKKLSDLKEQQEKEISELKKREEEFIKSNEELMDTDIYTVYKDIKRKFEEKIHECLEYRGQNEKISDENKLVKLNLDTSENMIKQCAKLQSNQQRIIKTYKEQIEDRNSQIEKLKEDYKNDLFEMNYKLTKIIEDKDMELKKIKHTLNMKNEENVNLRSLSQIILDQRSEIEQFFIESLEEVKVEVYKRKKAEERRGSYFPNLNKKYEDKSVGVNLNTGGNSISNSNSSSRKKINIKELLPEEKEKVLRMLFSKINENYKPKNYKNVDVSFFNKIIF